MTLEAQILERSREIKTDGYSMSIGEVLSMYRDGDLDVHPEFQRIFRWEESQKSRLIESILLGIPIPTIFVAQRDNGIWDVIDGVQRLSTIFEFVGVYKSEDGDILAPMVLQATEYLPELEGQTWEVDLDGSGRVFSDTMRRDFKRSKLDFRIVKKESDPDAKYDLFQRLNSGTRLSAQESRNCILVMLNSSFFNWMVSLSVDPHFANVVQISDLKEEEGFRHELVLRFILNQTFDQGPQELRKEFGEYLTDWARSAAGSPESVLDDWANRFSQTFSLLDECLGDNAFRRFDRDKDRFLGPFSISAFEVITAGVGAHIEAWVASESVTAGGLATRICQLWSESDFRANSGTGVSPRRRAPRLIHFGRDYFQP